MLNKFGFTFILLFSILVGGCVPMPSGQRKAASAKADISGNTGAGTNGDTTVVEDFNDVIVELRHIVDPYDGNYKTKVTIPKDYRNRLYISGLNLSQLRNKFVYARFRFGRSLTSITVPAQIGVAPGLAAALNIDTLILDFSRRPFRNLRLLYDLYDYNSYAAADEPITDPFNGKLYCRALDSKYDPTFQQTATTTTCSSAGDRCLYSYADVKDKLLHVTSETGVSNTPTQIQYDFTGGGYSTDPDASQALIKCLADDGNDTTTLGAALTADDGAADITLADATQYFYMGPYRSRFTTSWEITSDAIFGDTGLFIDSIKTPDDLNFGIYSLKFPRAGKRPIRAGVQHIGTTAAPFVSMTGSLHATRPLQAAAANDGTSEVMDGCNIRTANFDSFLQEGIESCQVTALIELVEVDSTTNEEKILNNISSSDVKLQIIRSTTKTPLDDEEIIASSFRTCSANAACGGDECCYNNRCWSTELVAQCIPDGVDPGSSNSIGESCSTDFDCQSLCCNVNTNKCSAHDGDELLCNKPLGTQCITKEFCTKVNQVQKYKVFAGNDGPTGRQLCEIRTYNIQVHGDCNSNGYCVNPATPVEPVLKDKFDCADAIDPPTNLN